jgi:hypothetical protein
VTTVYVLSRIAFGLAGVRIDMEPLAGMRWSWWQTLDPSLLQNHLLSSLWNLHSQPPLLNLFFGLLLKLPTALQQPVAIVCYWVMGWLLAVACFLLAKEIGLSARVSLLVTIFVMVSPEVVLYENLLFYTYPSAVLLTVSALCLVRYMRMRSWAYGAAFGATSALVVLLNSTFQWPWLLLAVVPLVILRKRRRQAVLLWAIPLVVVAGWYAKNATMFGVYSTSSWLGMNMDKITVEQAPTRQVRALIASGKLTPLAAVPPFRSLRVYVPRFAETHHSGRPALDDPRKRDASPNFNNLVYVGISEQYLRNDLHYVRLEPGAYAVNVLTAVGRYLEPADQYSYLGVNYERISGYARFFDAELEWQPSPSSDSSLPLVAHLAYEKVAEIALTLFGVPWLIWRRRRDVAYAVGLGFIWMTTVYVTAVVNLVELGENSRFRFDLGPLPLIASVAVVAGLIGAWTRTHRPLPVTEPRPVPSGPGAAPVESIDHD